MPLAERIITEIPLSKRGINLFSAIHDVDPGFAIRMQNCYFKRGVQGRLGHSKHSTNEVVTSKNIVGLHRFYFGTASKQLIAAAGTLVKTMNDTTGVWTSIPTITQTDSKQTHMNTWSAVDKVYIANGTDTPFSWDGTTATRLTAFPADTIMILPHRSRLLFISKTDPGLVRWTDTAFVDTSVITSAAALIRMTEGGQINVIFPHALAGTTEGINTWVLVATGSSIALMFTIDFLATGGVQTANTKLERVSDSVGIVAPRSVVSTPIGTIFLGSDRQVYLLRFGSFTPIPIGKFITSNTTSSRGIESMATIDIPSACAVYHDGFYKLSFTGIGGTNNDTQFWLDVVNIFKDEEGGWGPWFGPMVGMPPIAMFAVQNGPNDDGRLLGGHDALTGFVYRCNEGSVFADDGTAINTQYQTHHHWFTQSRGIDVVLNQYETEMESLDNSFNLSFRDTTGTKGSTLTVNTPVGAGTNWDSANWDSFNWATADDAIRQSDHLPDSNVRGRQLAPFLSYTSSTDKFVLFRLMLESSPLTATFQIEN